MLTFFTVPKAFEGHIGLIQHNAIASWKHLRPECEVFLMGDEDGVSKVAAELDCHHCPDIRCNEFGTPMLADIFKAAEENIKTEWLVYINADILLLDDFLPAMQALFRWEQRAVMIGRRTDIAMYEPLDFERSDWQRSLRLDADWHGTLREATALDFFAFPKGTYLQIPDFAIGRFSFDNWLVLDPITRGIPVVDATHDCLVLHQNHGYAHFQSESEHQLRKQGELDRNKEVQRNFALLGGWDRIFGAEEATHRLVQGQIVKGNQRALWRKQKQVYRREKRK
jgi:hypothetical protein